MKACDLIHGNFYKFIWKGSFQRQMWHFKFNKIENNQIYTFGYFHDGYSFIKSKNGLCNLSEIDEFDEVSFEYFIQFLPKDDPDMIIYHRKQKIEFLLNERF